MMSPADVRAGAARESLEGDARIQPAQVQPCGFLLELTTDWLIVAASENVRPFLSEYHVSLIGEPLAKFTRAQALHDLRNTLASQRSATGIARAYRVRLTEEPRHFDIAFQLIGSRIILEGVMSPEAGVGEALGSVSRLIDGLASERKELLEGAVRRMRALTGFDRAILVLNQDGERVESSRGKFPALDPDCGLAAYPPIIADTRAEPVAIFPRDGHELSAERALLRASKEEALGYLRDQGVGALLTIPVLREGHAIGCFSCDNRAPLQTTFEAHAAAELFAQMFAMRLELAEARALLSAEGC